MNTLEAELVKNLEFYLQYNKFRINLLLELMPQKKRPIFYVLPFLLHTNIKELPGYMPNMNTPCGIDRYLITDYVKNSLKKIFQFHSFPINYVEKTKGKECLIQSLLLMGSLGTVAQNPTSDFDYWVCINEKEASPTQLELLKKKFHLIEKWAKEGHGIEAHFYKTDIKKVQTNKFGEVDKDSVGSSQAKLLKEEFYRTSILVAGKIPFWWLTPADISDEEYFQYKKVAKESSRISLSSLIDLGNLNDITTEEFFGAALWQINKAMDSPYKSVLKMAMLEDCLDPEVETELLCNIVKKGVQKKNQEGKNGKYFDPYKIMFDHILESYKRKKKNDVLDLLATCFYIKIGLKAKKSDLYRDDLDFKERIITQYVKSWGWDHSKLDDLNDFKSWGLKKELSLGNQVHDFLIQTYRSLADRIKKDRKVKRLITDEDMTVLGRKLFSFYAQKPGKIQLMRRVFTEGLALNSVTFSAYYNKQRNIVWCIYRDKLKKHTLLTSDAKEKLLKQDNDIINILIWAIYNQMLDRQTSMHLIPNPSHLSLTTIQEFVNITLDTFPSVKISSLKNEALLSPSRKIKMLFVINFASPTWVKEIETISIIYLTSWGELFCESHRAKEGTQKAVECLVENLTDNITNLKKCYQIFVPSSNHSRTIYNVFNSGIYKNLRR